MSATSLRAGLDAISYHDRLANNWERRYEKASFRARLVALAECLDGEDLSGTGWLDAGCGTGTLSRWLAERGCAVLGVDAAPQMINIAAMLANSRGSHGQLRFQHVETIARLPLMSNRIRQSVAAWRNSCRFGPQRTFGHPSRADHL